MDKKTFCLILESALLNFDGVSEKELVERYGIEERLAKAGIELCNYLNSIEQN